MTAITIVFFGAFALSVALATGMGVYRFRAIRHTRKMELLRSGCILIISDFISSPPASIGSTHSHVGHSAPKTEYGSHIVETRQSLFAHAAKGAEVSSRQEIKNVILSLLRILEGEARTRLEELYSACGFADEAIERLASRVWWERAYAAAELGTARLEYSMNLLCDLLQDATPAVSLQAMHAVLAIGGAQVIPRIVHLLPNISATEEIYLVDVCMERGMESSAIIFPLLEDERDDVKRFALNALGAIHAYEETPVIVRFLQSKNRTLVLAAIRSLGNMGGEEPLVALERMCAEPDFEHKIEAAFALGGIGGAKSAQILHRLATDDDAGVRAAAANALAHIVRQESYHGENSLHTPGVIPQG